MALGKQKSPRRIRNHAAIKHKGSGDNTDYFPRTQKGRMIGLLKAAIIC